MRRLLWKMAAVAGCLVITAPPSLAVAVASGPSEANAVPVTVLAESVVEGARAVRVAQYVSTMVAIGQYATLVLYTEAVRRNQASASASAARASSINSRNLTPQRSYGSGGVGACTGFAIPDYIIQRESGGNPFVWNTQGSGAFGCAQTLISHYRSGQCVGMDPNTIDGQRQCVDKLSDHGTNLRPWGG